MTDEALLAAIRADAAASALADAGRDADCAARLSAVLPPVVTSHYLTEGGVLRVLGPAAGNAVLAAVEAVAASPDPSAPLLTRIVRLLRDIAGGGIDFGNPQVRAMLDQLAAGGVLAPASVAALKAAAEVPAAVPPDDVSRVLAPSRPGGHVPNP